MNRFWIAVMVLGFIALDAYTALSFARPVYEN